MPSFCTCFDVLAVCKGRQQLRISCKSGTEEVAQTNRRALLLALVAVPGLAKLQPAYAGKMQEILLPRELQIVAKIHVLCMQRLQASPATRTNLMSSAFQSQPVSLYHHLASTKQMSCKS